jgi:hypothetical protein
VAAFIAHDGSVVWKLGNAGIAKVLQSLEPVALQYVARDVLCGVYDGRADVFSAGIMAAELVVRFVDIPSFERAPAFTLRHPEHRAALLDDACARLDTVCPALATVVRGCGAAKAKHRMCSDAVLGARLRSISRPHCATYLLPHKQSPTCAAGRCVWCQWKSALRQ